MEHDFEPYGFRQTIKASQRPYGSHDRHMQFMNIPNR